MLFRKKENRHFIISIIIVALVTGCVMTRAIIGGVVDEYHIPFSEWPADLWLTQCFMILLYTAVFTGMLTVPLWYFFLGGSDQRG